MITQEVIRRSVEPTGFHLTQPVEWICGKDDWLAVKIEEPPGFALLHLPIGGIDFFSVTTGKLWV